MTISRTFPRAAVLLATSLASTAGWAANDPWDAPFVLQLGAFRADAETSVRLDADLNGGRRGTSISLESDLGVDKHKTSPMVDLLWRINPRHGIEASWVKLDREGTRTITGQIDFGDVSFPVNTAVDTKFNSDVIRVAYRYSPIHDDNVELSLLLGAHYTRIETSLTGRGGTVSDSASVDVPLPTIGVRGGARFAQNFRVTGFAQLLKLKVGDYDGELVNAGGGVEWAFMREAYVGVGYSYYRYKLDSEKSNAHGRFDYQFDGPSVYAAWAFR